MSTVYSNLKFLGYQSHIEAVRRREVVAPVHIRIKPVNHCNHNCWYCAYRVDNLQLGNDIDLRDRIPEAKLMEIAGDIVEMGVKAVTFSGGGEPLIYKALPEVVERLATGGVRVAALTNGSNLAGRMAEAFATHGTWLRVSLDGWDDASYSKSRGVPEGAFTRLLDNMRRFVALGSPCLLGTSFIVGKDNAAHLYDVCSMLKDVGVNHVKVAAAVVSNDGAENNRYHADISATVSAQLERAKMLGDDRFQVVNHYHETDERFEKGYDTCPFLTFLTVIGADSCVYTCQDKAYTESGMLGSIKDRSFKDFWFSDENRERMFALNPSVHCNHHCVAHLKNLALLDYINLADDHRNFV
ncbi:Putative radical SAM domain protein [Magnetospirillum sp. XM-1]|uniref:radical SAM/SPASM domain-containing protein n=1 Tax=Magnetospirillum sp. XM-1 TaxID=1663591 RepID=UPI00073DC55A|nr:radical SAM protein [Magnetospirillum sp. XM-1]CUW38014.1 Putative radical SAM domain protein [Magnetospirillum sp. XM-1]